MRDEKPPLLPIHTIQYDPVSRKVVERSNSKWTWRSLLMSYRSPTFFDTGWISHVYIPADRIAYGIKPKILDLTKDG